MAEDVKINISVEGNAQQVIKSITAAMNGLGDASEKNLKEASSAFSVFEGVLGGELALKALEKLAEAAEKLFDVFIVEGVKAASEYEASLNRLQVALAANGNLTSGASDSFERFAETIQKTTKFSDAQVLATGAQIETLRRLDGDALQGATKAALNLSAALGISLETAATLVGKAANGNIETFHRYGLTIKQGSTNAETFANTLAAIAKFGNVAEGQVKTFDGAVTQLSHAFEEVQKNVGQSITQNPAIIAALSVISKAFNELAETIKHNQPAIQAFITSLIDGLVNALPTVIGLVGGTVNVFLSLEQGLRGVAIAGASVIEVFLQMQKFNPGVLISGLFTDTVTNGIQSGIDKLSEFIDKQSEQIAKTEETKDTTKDIFDGILEDFDGYAADFLAKQEALSKQKVKVQNNIEAQGQKDLTEFEKKTTKQKLDDQAKVYGDIATLAKSSNTELFLIGKAAALAQATIQGYQAVAFALGSAPPPFNFALAALVGLANAVNIANIAATSPPGFATGSNFVEGPSGTDKIPAFLTRGERVFTTDQNQDFTRFLDREGNNSTILTGILQKLDNMANGVMVNIGGKTLVNTLNEELATGLRLNV